MRFWVYIYKNKKDDLKIGLSAVSGNLTSSILQKVQFVYLCPYDIPFDALAHKHLLDSLSRKSVLNWIHKHAEETKLWMNTVNENEKKIDRI